MEKKIKLPVYEMFVDEKDQDNEDSGVFTVSLVDQPAIISEYMVFDDTGKNFMKFKTVDNDRRIVTGPVMIPSMFISRNDEVRGNYYVFANKKTVEQSAMQFMKRGLTKSVNLMHESSLIPEGVFIFESWLIDRQRGTQEPKGFKQCPEGTWFMSMKIDNDEVWNDYIKTGFIRGFSVECNMALKEKPMEDATFLQDMEQWLGNRNI